MSFRLRLTLIAALAIAVTVTGASLALWLVAKHELRGQVDDSLRTQAALALTTRRPSPYGPQYAILDGSGTIIGGYENMNILPADRSLAFSTATSVHFSDRTVEGKRYRVLSASLVPGAVVVASPLAGTDHALARIRLWILLVGGGGIVLAAALAAFVAAEALRPVRRLTAAAEQVAATGDLTSRVTVTGTDELGRLATRFNAMLAALEESVGAQRRLVADASHELRTPLTAIRTNIDLLREGKLPEHERQAALSESAVELDELTRLVSDLVELARGAERQLRLEDIQLDDLVAGAVERAQTRAPQVQFVSQLTPTLVHADELLLDRAISNLLDNAVKWSPDGGAIEVTVNGGEVTVRDHGPGIAPSDLPHVFDRFYRAASARSKPGSGLGLAIVREAAEAHGGTATAETTEAGARFRLTLPAPA